jgi:hypothetical protein
MWLVETTTLELTEFIGKPPLYAILSHTWGQEEIPFKALRKKIQPFLGKPGYKKIEQSCAQAKRHGYKWIWIDSCCIDKRSSAELTEAINSMFKWYANAHLCYVYLEDTANQREALDLLETCRWFTRGWTLQELVAPERIMFYARDWSYLGQKSTHDRDFTTRLSKITGIDVDVLYSRSTIKDICIATRMSWAADRETTREEDLAYSLMGLFEVNMPILYGEGLRGAFERLQLEIIKKSPDQSIFAWRGTNHDVCGLLSSTPSYFRNSKMQGGYQRIGAKPFSMTNIGIQVTLELSRVPNHKESSGLWFATLRCLAKDRTTTRSSQNVQILLQEQFSDRLGEIRVFRRAMPSTLWVTTKAAKTRQELVQVVVPNSDQLSHLFSSGDISTFGLGQYYGITISSDFGSSSKLLIS